MNEVHLKMTGCYLRGKKPRIGFDLISVNVFPASGHLEFTYRVVQKKGTVLLSTSLAWPAVAGCSRAETFSQLSSISFAQHCIT